MKYIYVYLEKLNKAEDLPNYFSFTNSLSSSKTNNLNYYADLGDTVGVSSLLGQDSSNFSHHIAQGLIGQLPVLRPSKDATKLLDKTIQNKIVPKIVQAGLQIGNEWIIDSGLEATDQVAILGNIFIQPNSTIKPVKAEWKPSTKSGEAN